MRFSTIVAALLPIGVALSADHPVIVGANRSLVYEPATVTAAIGDTITFQL